MRGALGRQDRLDNSPLDYAPHNELGVVFLFSHLAKRHFGLRVEAIQAGFPDCTAFRGGKRVRIEFEYRSKNFAQHRHDPRACDWIVCWIHDWPACPPSLRVVELRKYFGKGFNVWVVPVTGRYRDRIGNVSRNETWSSPSLASESDLVLFYRTRPYGFIKDVFRLAGPVQYVPARWKSGKDWMAPITRVATLKAPIHLQELRSHPILKTAGFVRGGMRTRFRVTPHWPELYALIVDRNPSSRKALVPFGPARLA